jgi:hypothetical protein
LIPVVRKCWTLRGVRPTVPYQTKYEWAYLYSALEVDGQNAAEFLCLPEVSLEMSGLFLKHLAASGLNAEHIAIWDQAGFHPKPKLHAVPERVQLVSLPPYSPELNPTEAIGDVIKDRIGNVLWQSLDDLEEAIGEELRALGENAESVRRLVSHPWLVEQVNATAAENSAIACSNWYHLIKSAPGPPISPPNRCAFCLSQVHGNNVSLSVLIFNQTIYGRQTKLQLRQRLLNCAGRMSARRCARNLSGLPHTVSKRNGNARLQIFLNKFGKDARPLATVLERFQKNFGRGARHCSALRFGSSRKTATVFLKLLPPDWKIPKDCLNKTLRLGIDDCARCLAFVSRKQRRDACATNRFRRALGDGNSSTISAAADPRR